MSYSTQRELYTSGGIYVRANFFCYAKGEGNSQNVNNQGQKCIAKLTVLQPVFQYVENNLDRPMKIDELSAIVNMSEKYFISYFKSALGITPGNYITQLKMNKARDYLYQEKYSIKEIANLLGYSDQYTFSKAFKKYFNVSPSKFI